MSTQNNKNNNHHIHHSDRLPPLHISENPDEYDMHYGTFDHNGEPQQQHPFTPNTQSKIKHNLATRKALNQVYKISVDQCDEHRGYALHMEPAKGISHDKHSHPHCNQHSSDNNKYQVDDAKEDK